MSFIVKNGITISNPDVHELLLIRAARKLEAQMLWGEAAAAWDDIGESDNAEACRHILACNAKADEFRAVAAELQSKGVSYWDSLGLAQQQVYG